MTANILDNELVKKYFGVNEPEPYYGHGWGRTAQAVLHAMQEPIRLHEKHLQILESNGEIIEIQTSIEYFGFHPYHLRLPDKFQKRECESHCCEYHKIHDCTCQPQRDEVEEKIEWLVSNMPDITKQLWKEHLRELVRLAKKSK